MTQRKYDYMMTYSGKQFKPLNPTPDMIDIHDIAHSLSRLCRFNGQCDGFYSVAFHCVAVSKELESRGASLEVQMMGLLHDAPEAYLSDIPSPVKQYLPDYMKIENNVEKVIYNKFGIDTDLISESGLKLLKYIDYQMCLAEAVYYTPNPIWVTEKPDINVKINVTKDYNSKAKEEYLDRFYELSLKLNNL